MVKIPFKPAKKIDGGTAIPKIAAAAAATAPTLGPVAALELNARQAEKRSQKAREDATTLRRGLWPEIGNDKLWLLHDKKRKGFAQLPRPMPLFMSIINDLSKRVGSGKSVPAGRAYLVLWCRERGEAIVQIPNEMVAAFEAGYGGERSVSTWREHLRVLNELGFIDYKASGASPMHFVLLLNPYVVVKELRKRGWVPDSHFAPLLQLATEIRAGAELVE